MAKNCRANLDPITYSLSEFAQMCVHAHVRETRKKKYAFAIPKKGFEKWCKVFMKENELDRLSREKQCTE